MKTRKILIAFGAAAVAAVTLNINASAALLSPRASGNVVIHTEGTRVANPLAGAATAYAAPRQPGRTRGTVAVVSREVNPATLCARSMAASPKSVQACAANASAPMPCCTMAGK